VRENSRKASAARLAGMDRQTLRDWVHRYNEGGIAAQSKPDAAGALATAERGSDGSTEGVVLAGLRRATRRRSTPSKRSYGRRTVELQ